ncbi:hypothetical protein [Nocardia australiensis]|uniref:hypothetical protein n=1 Tax=Nocardia australiensis TaxID=2887191 RepID=UPI001D135F0C|nr:hypothetical protein [Nocardia australiensis]
MTALDIDRARAALTPVADELQHRATMDAQRIVAEAEADAGRILDEARSQAEEMLARARSAAVVEIAALRNTENARIRRELRADLLTARRLAYDQLRHEATVSVLALHTDSSYPALRDRLRDTARQVLGSRAVMREPAEGGIIAETGHRRLDLGLSALAARALDRIAPEIDGLWT